LLAACLAYSLTLKMEAVQSSEISVNFYPTERHAIPEERVLNIQIYHYFKRNVHFENFDVQFNLNCGPGK
jgi:hypothetical protein